MENELSTKEKARAENNDKLWEVLNLYVDDPEGLTKYEAIALADFNMSEGGSKENVFTRALGVCRTRAKRANMFIPRATPVKGRGHVYVLTKRGVHALEGFMAQENVSRGVRRSAAAHQQFIERDRESLPPLLRTVFDEVSAVNEKYEQFVNESLETQRKQLESVYEAYKEEQKTA